MKSDKYNKTINTSTISYFTIAAAHISRTTALFEIIQDNRCRTILPAHKWLPPFACPVWARERCRISTPRFLAECCKRQLNQGSFGLLHFRLFTFSDLYWVCLSIFACTVLFVSISQVIGCEDRLRNDLYCVEWSVKLYSNQRTSALCRRCLNK